MDVARGKEIKLLSDVALKEDAQFEEVHKKSMRDFHKTHPSGSGTATKPTPSTALIKPFVTNEGTGVKSGVPDVTEEESSESEAESWGNDDDDSNNDQDSISKGSDQDKDSLESNQEVNEEDEDDEEEVKDEFVKTPSNDSDDEDETKISDKAEGDKDKEMDYTTSQLYDDVDIRLNKPVDTDKEFVQEEGTDAAMTNSGFKQEEEDAHVTLTPVLDTQKSGGPTQSYYVSSDFTSKLLNLDNPSPADNEIASLMDTTAQHATAIPKITSSFTTTNPPPPLFFNPLSQQATPTLTPTASETTTSHPTLLDFASIFKFNERVFNLEKDLSEMKQVDQYAQALSSIPAIDEKNAYIELVDTSMRAIIKEEVNTQLPQILPQVVSDFVNPVIEKNVTESVEAAVLTRSSSQPTSTYKAVASLSEFELTKILIDKMEKNKSYDKSDNTDNDFFDLFGEVFSLKRIRDESDKDRDPFAESD
ncbi:hypothetical protein Tco_0085819 [Tanacetum coccineum]